MLALDAECLKILDLPLELHLPKFDCYRRSAIVMYAAKALRPRSETIGSLSDLSIR
jgi:hypothetical protein